MSNDVMGSAVAVGPQQAFVGHESRACAGEPRSRTAGGGARGERVRRALRILLQLLFHPESLTLSDLVPLLGVSRRTVFRDIQLLRDIGLPILFDPDRGHYRLLRPARLADPAEAAAALEAVLDGAPAGSQASRPLTDWWFNWEQSVALLAVLRAAPAPAGTEWKSTLQGIEAELTRRLRRAFGRKAGTVSAHAALLAFKPHLSVANLRSEVEQFWQCSMEPNGK